GQETLVIDFVTRVVDGYETAVVLLQGEKARHEFVTRLEQHIFAKLDFNFLLSPRILRECRLREFGRYLPGGIPVRARPTYTRPEVGESFAFNATTWVAPDFENYFADDEDAGRKLDEVYQQKESLEMSDRELLRLFRRGVRRSKQTPNEMFGWISGALGWPLDPMLSEIMFQAVDPRGPFPFRDAAVYYGYNLNKPKTKNMLEALVQAYLAEPFDRTSNSNFRGRILWSVRDHEDHRYFLATRFESALKNHQQLSDEALRPTDLAYRQLANRAPPNQHEYDHRIVDVVGFVIPENQSLMAAKQLFEDRMESNEFLLDTEIRQEKNQVQGLSVTRGFEGPRLLAAKLKEEFNWPVNFALPLTPVVWKELGDKLPARFQDYLPVTK
ncbi:hypothetical protein, partial [Schlesneria sp.]